MEHLAIFASGGGSNAQVIMDYFKENDHIKIALVVVNNKNAGVISRAEKAGIPVVVHTKEDLDNGGLLNILAEHGISFIVLAGYLKMIPADLSLKFHHRIVNIHPALLPNYGGKGMYGMNVHKAVFENREKVSGITIHYVNERYDEGEVIAQFSCDISDCLSAEEIQRKVLELEHQYFAKTIEKVLTKI